MIQINAEIKNIRYSPTLCSPLREFRLADLDAALQRHGNFLLEINPHTRFAVSRWVSPKRTRSYPYVRVYDTLQFTGRRVTIIPICKDEGLHGERDYLQWDTVSLMSLLGIYVLIGYYVGAQPNRRDPDRPKITHQVLDIPYLKEKFFELMTYQSDPLHWNLEQVKQAGELGEKAIAYYAQIAKQWGIPMHSEEEARSVIRTLGESIGSFTNRSRALASSAAQREVQVTQPRENVAGEKAKIVITNYLGGEYHLTVDECRFKNRHTVQLIEAKHTTSAHKRLPSLADIKDALLKMILFTNLENVTIAKTPYQHEALIKLTSLLPFDKARLTPREGAQYEALLREAKQNGFAIIHE